MDVFYLDGIEYLATVNRYSKWPTCYMLRTSSSREIITLLERQFLDFGCPETCVTDNASYFTSADFRWFMQERDIKHITCSPLMSRSNGLAERMNQTIKNSLAKESQSGSNLNTVLSCLRSTPLGNGLPSPSVLLQGRNFRDNLHCTSNQLKTQQLDLKKIQAAMDNVVSESHSQQQDKFPSQRFVEGMTVWVKTGHRKWEKARILGHADTPRSFHVEMLENGKVCRRNQSYLKVYRDNGSLHDQPACPTPVTSLPALSHEQSASTGHSAPPLVPVQVPSGSPDPPSGTGLRTSTRSTQPVKRWGYGSGFKPVE
jgi:hypothetical protein